MQLYTNRTLIGFCTQVGSKGCHILHDKAILQHFAKAMEQYLLVGQFNSLLSFLAGLPLTKAEGVEAGAFAPIVETDDVIRYLAYFMLGRLHLLIHN